jgi:pimeloyl-ACP methyl ester carboxylesterase
MGPILTGVGVPGREKRKQAMALAPEERPSTSPVITRSSHPAAGKPTQPVISGGNRMTEGSIRHRHVELGGVSIFLREAGPEDAPVLLLPHGYPCSSFQFRRLMPALAERWRTVAFDWPGFGYSGTPDPVAFAYDFDGYEKVLTAAAQALGLYHYALWLHDYGSQIGLRHAIAHPDRITSLIIQNGDIYEDVLGPKYATIKAWWEDKTPEKHRPLEEAVSEEGFRAEFVGEVGGDVAERVPPDCGNSTGR